MKKVSVVVPCYNQEPFIRETLESVLKQTYRYWECIVVDDGSTDSSAKIILDFCRRDHRFKYIYKQNTGVVDSRNLGIRQASGFFILPLDGDDLIGEEYLSKAVDVFEKEDNVTLVYCRAQFIGERQGEWYLERYSYKRMLYCNLIFNAAMYRKTDFLQTIGYNSNMVHGLEDWDFWLTLLNEESRVFCIDQILFYYRIRSGSRNWEVDSTHFEELGRQLYLNHKEAYNKYINPALDYRQLELMERRFLIQKQKTKKYRQLFFLLLIFSLISLLLAFLFCLKL